MHKRIVRLAFTVALCAGGSSAMAQDVVKPADAPYPDPQCIKPALVKRPVSNNDAAEAGIYNAKVKVFNREAKAYNECIRAYVDKANLDVTRIHDQASEDQKRMVETANASMKAVRDKIERALAESNALIAAQNNGGSAN